MREGRDPLLISIDEMFQAHRAGNNDYAESTARILLANADLPLLLRARKSYLFPELHFCAVILSLFALPPTIAFYMGMSAQHLSF